MLQANLTTSSPASSQAESSQPASQWLEQLHSAWRVVEDDLLSQSSPEGTHWTGQLSTSALSTATAVSGLVQMRQHECLGDACPETVNTAIEQGCRWLADHQNADGGFGDTDRSHSNIATTLLVLAAWNMVRTPDNPADSQADSATRRAWDYVRQQGQWEGLKRRYGKDKTFVVPIMSNCALAGLIPWTRVAPLPFEAAWLPQDWYRLARMPVVSYAIPALVAIGQARFQLAPPRNPLTRAIRRRAQKPTLEVLQNMQPASGGYLEAVPLTSFVLMNLAAIGQGTHPVSQNCLRFLLDSRLADGSWPIDTNLATWVTSLSIGALARKCPRLSLAPRAHETETDLPATDAAAANTEGKARPFVSVAGTDLIRIRSGTIRWLLSCQHKSRHPFTGANPGGWGWTNLSGAVPDADDTPAALLALASVNFEPQDARLEHEVAVAAARGLRWLLKLQNRDGGWPTFCRGWGKLPFDRSGTDLTAHAIRAFHAWTPRMDALRRCEPSLPPANRIRRAIDRGFRFLERHQQPDGSWLPLWFGNQDRAAEDNPVYGTGKVLLAYAALQNTRCPAATLAQSYLRAVQNGDGGWGGGESIQLLSSTPEHETQSAPMSDLDQTDALQSRSHSSTLEETAIAVEALIQCGGDPGRDPSIMRGLNWLTECIHHGNLKRSAPIGFYFAKLWYYERMYPAVFSLGALGAAIRVLSDTKDGPRG